MPAVFIHGNPESSAIWSELVPHLARSDVVTLSPPGFGAAVPEGFGASANEYFEWLADKLVQIDGPIDLVGHDWGGLLVIRIAMERPELVRSWASDVAGGYDPNYVWHDMAQVWQTPDAGEQLINQITETPAQARALRYQSLGMSKATATAITDAFDDAMGRCILALYRSAMQPAMINWGKRLSDAAAKPGLVIVATEDHLVGGEELARRSAAKCGASVAILRGLGHWWMSQAPLRGAGILNGFWSSIGPEN